MNQAEFLRLKVKLISEHAVMGDADYHRSWTERWERAIADPDYSNKTVEEEINVVLRNAVYPKAKRDAIKKELVDTFGTYSLGAADEAIAKKVIKRGNIETEEEFNVVKELLVNYGDEGDEDITPSSREKLEAIMANYEKGT